MSVINLADAEHALPRLIESIEQGTESEIVIARQGRPVARLVPMQPAVTRQRLGIAKGCFEVPDSIDAHNEEVARLFWDGMKS